MPDKYGTFEALLKITPDHLHDVAKCLKALVLAIHPDTCEVVRLGDKAATYGLGPKKMSEGYVYILPHSQWVNLGFYKGADLDDPNNLLEGTGAKMRHIKIRTVTDVEQPAIAALIQAALAERTLALEKK